MPQFQCFLICAALGFCGGALRDSFTALFYPLKKFPLAMGLKDALFCVVFAGVYLCVSLILRLPPIRFYLILGLIFGFILWLESLHKTLAFLANRVYNSIVSNIRKRGKAKRCRVSLKKRKSASR